MDDFSAAEPKFKDFLGLLFKDWAALVSGGLSVPCSMASYYSSGKLAKTLFSVLAVMGFLYAAYRMWAGERNKLALALQELAREKESRELDFCLRIHSYEKSCFTVITDSNNRSQNKGIHVNLDLAIENCGKKGLAIDKYELLITETNQLCEEIKPNLSFIWLQGRYCVRDITSEPKITTDGLIRVPAGSISLRGFLPFYPLQTPPRIDGKLHCRLTVHTTDKQTASQLFELSEV